jgi:hypothetical protein
MAQITVQETGANGQASGVIAFTQAEVGGDFFEATGNEIVLVKAGAAWIDATAQIEGVPDSDAGRDGTSLLTPLAVGDIDSAGFLKQRNWAAGANVQLTYPGGILGLEVAILRPKSA